MVTKLKKPTEEAAGADPLAGTIKDSAQQIWLAGLGAFSKAQAEGGKMFESLVREGVAIQRKTQSVAEEKLTEATSRMASMATELSSKASGQWDKLETIFEDRVSRAMNKLGVPSARDIEALVARIDELQRSVDQLSGKTRTPRPAARAAKRAAPARPAAKTPRKRAAPRSRTDE